MMEQTENEYRGYFFGNFYLSQIQQGIQAAHCLQNMATRYNQFSSSMAAKMFLDWCKHDKTMILLNGGAQADLKKLAAEFSLLTAAGTAYPACYFEEEESALNGAVTSVGIVLPKSVYAPCAPAPWMDMKSDDYEIYRIISNHKLA